MSKILIVDDNPQNVKVLSAALSEKGYTLMAAPNGERALQIAERALPDLILLDINMPGINGYETCTRLKAKEDTAAIPVIFLSALDDVDSKVEGFRVGGVDYVTKPFNKEEVLIRVQTHLRLSELTRELEKRNHILGEALEEIQTIQDRLYQTNNTLIESINCAKQIQDSFLKPIDSLKDLFPESFVLFYPKHIVSGDFYWFSQRRNKIFLVGADCTGHGVPGAFLTIIGINLLEKLIAEQGMTDPAEVLEEMDDQLQKILRQQEESVLSYAGMDIAIAAIDTRNWAMQYAGARRPIYHARQGVVTALEKSRHCIGGGQTQHSGFITQNLQLNPNDRLYFSSDGFTDQFGGPRLRKFNSPNFLHLLTEMQVAPLANHPLKLQESLAAWQGIEEQTDDILVFGVEIP